MADEVDILLNNITMKDKFCRSCGTKFADEDKFCGNCGKERA
jgi:predicted amidophosphoribosyltransferase